MNKNKPSSKNTDEILINIIKKAIEENITSSKELEKLKRKFAKKHRTPLAKNINLIKVYHNLLDKKRIKRNKKLEKVLRVNKVRSWSGVAVVAVVTKPYPCPGECVYCPQQNNAPKSYLTNEPAIMRAVSNDYDPYKQTKSRIESLKATGHPVDKIELIILGGTWSYLPEKYQQNFIKRCFDAANEKESDSLEEAQKKNETSNHRIIGLTLETRPDYINKKEIKKMRHYGATRVEIGVQSTDNEILKLIKRGHKVEDSVKATYLLKEAGFKVGYHLMPNLPGATPETDRQMFKEVFSDPRFKPDLLKIYPTAIVKGAPLYQWWEEGQYEPYSEKEMIELLKDVKSNIPIYCRIQRTIRDIPSKEIVTGPAKISNLREVILKQMKEEGRPCQCIRCREVKDKYDPEENLKLYRLNYKASKGEEVFLSFENENRNKLYALLRLRIPAHYFNKEKHFIKALQDSAIIRQVHTYGFQLSIDEKKEQAAQHHGLGKKLIQKAEEIIKEEYPNIKKMAVISGIGVREYYRHLGYKQKGTYMVKRL